LAKRGSPPPTLANRVKKISKKGNPRLLTCRRDILSDVGRVANQNTNRNFHLNFTKNLLKTQLEMGLENEGNQKKEMMYVSGSSRGSLPKGKGGGFEVGGTGGKKRYTRGENADEIRDQTLRSEI